MKYILVATQDQKAYDTIKICFEAGYKVEIALSKESALESFQKKRYDFLFIDIEMLKSLKTENDYKNQLQLFWRVTSDVEVIVLSPPETIREAVNAVKAGASNYLTYPLNTEEVKYVVDSLQEYKRLSSELDYFRDRFWRTDSLSVLQTNCMAMKEVFAKVRAVAPTESTVLLTGETGTGKGVIARLIHQHSKRSANQFISVHCGAIPDTLLESELFGHEKGAFTGAVRRKLGKFEIAHGGTIFLDEIGTISAAMQIKLLQVLQERIIVRVGGENVIKTDVRIIAATNTNLKKMCDDGTFRSDLYYRLNVFPIEVPPLRERVEDIPILVENFLKRLNKSNAKHISDIHPDVLDAFEAYSWPGNIRELENLIERAYILETSSILTPKSFPIELFSEQIKKNRHIIDTTYTLREVRKHELERIERQYLTEVLSKNRGKIKATAEVAGISERQLHKLLTRYGILKEDFKVNS
jgi:DNA-binding NtrC family response regulator